MIRIGINGFGRIGRLIARINALKNVYKLVAINDINPHADNLAYLFKYDSTYGKFDGEVTSNEKTININHQKIAFFSNPEINNDDWKNVSPDVIIDSSGVEGNVIGGKNLINDSTIKKIIVTHCSDNVDREIILGVNDNDILSSDHIVSNSTCDANAIAHVLRWFNEEYGIDNGSVTTLHPWLSYQNLTDGASLSQSKPGVIWNDYALGRASSASLIPKETTAVRACEKVIPEIIGKILCFSYRIPTDIVASSDVVLNLQKTPSYHEVKQFLEEKIRKSKYVKGNYESLVSLDYEREEASAVIDMQWVKVQNGLVKMMLWYDNEWGYSTRVLDLVDELMKR